MPRQLPKGVRDPAVSPMAASPTSTAWAGQFGWPGTTVATDRDVYGLPAAWRCLNWIANAVASCAPPQVHGPVPGERLESPQVVANPWPMLTSHEYWRAVTASLVLHGNYIGFPTDWDPVTGWPRQVVPLDPTLIEFQVVDGVPVYRIGEVELGPLDVIHIRGYTPPGGLWGVGVIEAFRNMLGEGSDHQSYATNLYGGSAVPPLVIQVDDPDLTETGAEAVQDRFYRLHKGGNKEPAVIPSSMDVRTLAFTPADS